MTEREIYPNAPLRFVAFEMRYTTTPRLGSPDGALSAWERVREHFPVLVTEREEAGVELGPTGARSLGTRLRATTRTRTASLVIGADSVVVETTDYRRFEDFKTFLEAAVHAVAPADPAAYIRLGLRYVDEVRLDTDVVDVEHWREFISPSLMAPLALCSTRTPTQYQGVLTYDRGQGFGSQVRYGTATGRFVGSDGPLKISRETPSGDYFLIDIDSYWNPDGDELPEFSFDAIQSKLEPLHDPVHDLFESSITSRLRDDVLRQQPTVSEA